MWSGGSGGGERGLDKSDRSWWASWARRRGQRMMIRRCRRWCRHLSTGRKERSLRDLSRPLIGQNHLSRPLIGQNPPPSPPGFLKMAPLSPLLLSSEALLLHSDLASRSEPVSQNSGLAEHRSDQPTGGRGGHWP